MTLRHGCSAVNLLHIFRTPFTGDLLILKPAISFGKNPGNSKHLEILIWKSSFFKVKPFLNLFQYVLELLELNQIYFLPGLSRVKCYNLLWSNGFHLKGEFRDHFSLKFGSFSWSSRPEVFCKNVFLEIFQNSQENTCVRVSSSKKESIKEDSLAQVFSCEFCEISKKGFF